MRKNRLIPFFVIGIFIASLSSCTLGSGQGASLEGDGDTITLKYSKHLTLVKHADYVEAVIANPWQENMELHRYLLVPKGQKGDEIVMELKKRRTGRHEDIIRTPLSDCVVYTSPHIQLMYELGCDKALKGVCDLSYINIADVKYRASLKKNGIVDCGSSMQPSIERIIALHPEALFISPFENSGGYGKLDKLNIPIIETADYMETSPLGRAEWMRFYGLLFGGEGQGEKKGTSGEIVLNPKADSLFCAIEKQYLSLKDSASHLPLGRSILTERKMGSVWYVPGGKSTTGILLSDAHAQYVFADDNHSGSLALSPEQILAKATHIDVWAFKYLGTPAMPALGENKSDRLLTGQDLLQEYKGYSLLKAFRDGEVYECNTNRVPFFEYTSFHPERLLREYILLAHPKASIGGANRLLFFSKMP